MTYTVQQFRPQVSVTAWHQTTKYDLTPYVMQVTTHKALGETMGQWALLLTFQKRWDRILKTMDYIEIRMSRYNATPQIIMRGFISNIRRTRTMDRSGAFRRAITVNGNDFGKIIQNYDIYYMANIPGQQLTGTDVDPAEGLLAPLLSENLGAFKNATDGIIPLSDFVPTLAKHTTAPYIQSLQKTTPAIPNLATSVNVLSDYTLNWLTLQTMQGGLDGILTEFCNSPWCEWFVFDAADGPKLIHRNTPFKDSQGRYIFPESQLDPKYWPTVTIKEEDIIEEDIGFTDSEVYDYFFTYPTLFTDGDLAYKYAVINSGEFGNGNAQAQYGVESDMSSPTNPKLIGSQIYRYGLRIMEQDSPAIPVYTTDNPDTLSIHLSIEMNMWLANSYSWAADQLNGTLRLRGNENIQIGKYLFSETAQEEYYIESVDHTFSISQPGSLGNDQSFYFETVVGLTRGRVTSKPDSGVTPSNLINYTGQDKTEGGNAGNIHIVPTP